LVEIEEGKRKEIKTIPGRENRMCTGLQARDGY